MSKFEDYDSASRHYDDQRYAMGSDVMAAMVQFHCGKPLKDLHVLDAGCGTGNYAKALIEYGVGHVTLLDASSGMLEKAKEKLSYHIKSGKVKDVVEATMPPLPFPDHSFDAVMFNLVLHHLEANPDGEHFPVIEEVLKESRRVLKPSGIVAIVSGPTEEIYNNIWFVHLNKNICRRHLQHHPQHRQWDTLFQKSGLRSVSYMNYNTDLRDDVYRTYLDPEGPLKKEWRNCNSYWASATDDDIKEVERKINELKKEGTLDQFVKEHDKCRRFFVVLHHLENDDGNFIAAIDALKEAKRVLKPNGLLVLSTVLPSHIKYVIWYSQIHEGLTERFCKRMPSSDKLQNMFSSAALKCIQKMNILGTLLNDYYNAEGPLDENWRKTVSYWSFATEEEIDYILKFVENLKEKGELNKWVREHDHANTSGFLSIYMCKA